MERQAVLDMQADFTWGFGQEYYVDADNGKQYIWSSPEYGGDNSFKETKMSYADWIAPNWGRNKGKHVVRNYCGSNIYISPLPRSPDEVRSKLQQMIERFAVKHAVSTDVAKQMISDRHNRLAQEADDAIAHLPVSIDGT